MKEALLRVVGKEEGSERKRALDAALSQIDRALGKGSVMRLGQREPVTEADTVSTGSLGLDIALGIGGLPRGRVVEIYGPESSGKTTLALHAVAEAQKKGGIAAYIDAEHALDPIYARKLGVDVDELLISQPDTGEQALEITDTLVRSGGVDIVVIDSVAALTPKAELEGELRDLGVKAGAVEKSGSWFSYDGTRIGQGREAARNFLEQNKDVAARIEAQIRQNAGLLSAALAQGDPDGGGAD